MLGFYAKFEEMLKKRNKEMLARRRNGGHNIHSSNPLPVPGPKSTIPQQSNPPIRGTGGFGSASVVGEAEQSERDNFFRGDWTPCSPYTNDIPAVEEDDFFGGDSSPCSSYTDADIPGMDCLLSLYHASYHVGSFIVFIPCFLSPPTYIQYGSNIKQLTGVKCIVLGRLFCVCLPYTRYKFRIQ